MVAEKQEKVVMQDEEVSLETNRSLARCIFGGYLGKYLDNLLQLTENGMDLLGPVLEDPHLKFLAKALGAEEVSRLQFLPGEVPETERNYSLLTVLRDRCAGIGETISRELFIQRFISQMLDGTLVDIDGLGYFISDAGGVKLIEKQLLQYQLPLVDFLTCLGMLVITRLEEVRLLKTTMVCSFPASATRST